ncbi:MAG: rhomboid family intramembrane serine protease [Saprospiraceae bacterium]|nr:rhomboid family intramembrane serine protease [Saprospiraceae bacterium]
MFRSIADDIKSSFDYGNMIVKLIIINIAVFVITALLSAFFPLFYATNILPYIAIPGDLITLLYRPWTIVTHMFLHDGLWHLIGNMITLYWFGNIAGDLLGDKKILPVYILGGLMGALFYILSYQFLPNIGVFALGASAAVLAIVFTAVATAPDYVVSLVLLGDVRIKFIGLVILFLDIIGTQSNINSGGHIAHLGGTLFGFLFVYLLRSGRDLSLSFNNFIDFITFKKRERPKRKTTLKVAHRAENFQQKATKTSSSKTDISIRVDEILDKIKQKGYDSLTDEEKEVLYHASKN